MTLSVIIVCRNRFDLLEKAVASVQTSRLPFPYEIIVVDNASAGDIHSFLKARFPEVKLIRNPINLGFGAANNQGIALSLGKYILLLNSDARVEPDAVVSMVERMETEPDIGILAPLILDPDGSFQLSYGKRIGILSEWRQKFVLPHREKRRMGRPPRRDIFTSKDWVSASCCLLRRSLFPDASVFDEAFFLYFEDHDLCLRVRKMGKRVVYWSEPAAVHLGGGSMPSGAVVPLEYRRSQLYIYRKHASLIDRFLLPIYLYIRYFRNKEFRKALFGQGG